jgi:putative effector of murein hydrolase
MRKALFITIGLVLLNLLFFELHRIAFQSSEPFLVIITFLIHLFVVIKIPYEKIYKKEE